MKYFRRSTIALVAYLAFLFNVERLDFGQQNLIDIQSQVYVIVFFAVTSIISVPGLARLHLKWSLAFWTIVYLVCKAFAYVVYHLPFWGGLYTYLSITEMLLLLAGVWLAHDFGRGLRDFEETVRNLTLADAQHRVQTLADAEGDIQKELIRSRRHNYPLSVIVVEPRASSIQAVLNQTIHEIQQAMMTRYVIAGLGRIISDQLRRTDLIIAQHTQGRFVIVSPDTGDEKSVMLAERIRSAAQERLDVSIDYGIASFPNEALTFEDLVNQAEDKLGRGTGVVMPSASIPAEARRS